MLAILNHIFLSFDIQHSIVPANMPKVVLAALLGDFAKLLEERFVWG